MNPARIGLCFGLVLGVTSALAAELLKFTLQKRVEAEAGGEYRIVSTRESWDAKQTAIIVCDMWDLHHCKNAVRREGEMAPRMNALLEKARAQGREFARRHWPVVQTNSRRGKGRVSD